MKLEKREVTLDEKDTLKDVLFCERSLAKEYVSVAPCLEAATHRESCAEFLDATLATVFDVADLLRERLRRDKGSKN